MSTIKILMSSANNPKYLAFHYHKFLTEELGADNVLGFSHTDLFNKYYTKSIWNKIIYKFLPKRIENKISKKLIDLCESFKPSVVLIFKGMEINPKSIEYLKHKNIFLINYNLDHPFEYFSRGSGNKNVLKSLPFYNLHLTYSQKIKTDFKEKRNYKNVEILPFGYALSDELFDEINNEIDEICSICFIGNPDNKRIELIQSFLNEDLNVDVYGENWDKSGLNDNKLQICKAAYNDDYWKTLRKYRVQLNVFRPHNYNSHNMRSFEVPAVGGIMLAPYSKEHSEFFVNEEEAFYYNSTNEAINLSKKILNLTSKEANKIRQKARLKSVNLGYSYQARAMQLIQIIKNNIYE